MINIEDKNEDRMKLSNGISVGMFSWACFSLLLLREGK